LQFIAEAIVKKFGKKYIQSQVEDMYPVANSSRSAKSRTKRRFAASPQRKNSPAGQKGTETALKKFYQALKDANPGG
jgi:hypothetical protein